MTELTENAIEAALRTAHARVVSPSKHKWPDGYVNEDYPYKPYWETLMDSLESRLEAYQERESTVHEGQTTLQGIDS